MVIGGWAIGGYKVEKVTLPDTVTTIEDYAFSDCINLKDITLPASVTTVGDLAFWTMAAKEYDSEDMDVWGVLENIYVDEDNSTFASVDGVLYNKDVTQLIVCPYKKTSITLPATVTDIYTSDIGSALEECYDLESINVNENNTTYTSIDGVLYNKDATKLIRCPAQKSSVTIPDTVETIGESAFMYCLDLTSIAIPESVKTIEDWAFTTCTSLTSVTIPKTVENIGNGAFGFKFDEYYGIQPIDGFKIYCYAGTAGEEYAMTGKSEGAFDYELLDDTSSNDSTASGSSGTSAASPSTGGGPDAVSTQNGYTIYYVQLDDETYTMSGANENAAELVIPELVEGVKVTSIMNSAFCNNTVIESVTIPASVTSIGSYAFLGCTSPKSVTVPSTVTEIGEYALGYVQNADGTYEKLDGFVMYCAAGSAAEQYGITYKLVTDDSSSAEASSSDDSSSKDTSGTSNSNSNDDSPKTGAAATATAALLLSAAAVVAVRSKKK